MCVCGNLCLVQHGYLWSGYVRLSSMARLAWASDRQTAVNAEPYATVRHAASEVTRKNASVYETQLTKFYRCVFVRIMK